MRNSRDGAILQGKTFEAWERSLQVDEDGNITFDWGDGCFSDSGCIIDPYTNSAQIKECSGACPFMTFYEDNSFYGYSASATHTYPFSTSGQTYQTTFVRKIKVTQAPADLANQLIVEASISWKNGTADKTLSQTTLLTNWTP